MTKNRPPFDTDRPADGLAYSDLADMLEWQSAAGVDMAISTHPVDQFAAHKASTLQTKPGHKLAAPAMPLTIARPEGDIAQAAALAKAASTLEDLRAAMARFEGSALKMRATQLVFATGNLHADIMLVGEAPGREEDLQGAPFVGKSGVLLDRMLAAIGLNRDKVLITNTIGWRPPGNRLPSPTEIDECLPFLHRQIELASPKILLTLGAVATQTLFAETVSITKARGHWRDLSIGSASFKALPTFHPAFLLRQPAQKRLAWQDLISLKQTAMAEGLI